MRGARRRRESKNYTSALDGLAFAAPDDVAELIHEFATQIKDREVGAYAAQAWGRRMEDGRWEGWLVFLPIVRGFARRTGRETTQANLEALAYWVSGLEPVYLEGALHRSYPLRLDSAA